jgi:hypothetical protein
MGVPRLPDCRCLPEAGVAGSHIGERVGIFEFGRARALQDYQRLWI